MDLIAELAPAVHGTSQMELFDGFDGTIECHPGHHLRMSEVTTRPANLPNPFIWLFPRFFEIPDQFTLYPPTVVLDLHARDAAVVQHVCNFAEDVELELRVSGVP